MPIIVETLSAPEVTLPDCPPPAGPATIEAAIEATAKGPASVTIGNQSATAQSLANMIEADKYLERKSAIAGGKLPIAFAQFVTGPDS